MQPKYLGRPPREQVTNSFEHSLRQLLGRPTRASVEQLLGNRASYGTIRQWRCGNRKPAQWATEILATEHERRAAESLQQARTIRLAASPGALGSIHALGAWRARRAAQKEKARE